MKEKIPILVAIIFAIIAFVGISQYIRENQKSSTYDQILVLGNSKLAGEQITEGDLKVLSVDRQYAQGLQSTGVYKPTDRALLIGQRLAQDVAANTPIIDVLLDKTDQEQSVEKFSMKLRPGQRALSLPVDSAGSVSSFIRVGDRVDILANLAFPQEVERVVNIPNQGQVVQTDRVYKNTTVFLFENVQVLAVGNVYQEEPAEGQQRATRGGGSTVTIAVTPREAQILSWAMRHGHFGGGSSDLTFTLLLRSPEDDAIQQTTDLKVVEAEDLLDVSRIRELQNFRLALD